MSSALAFRNLADAGSLSASSGAARMPVSLLQNVHVARKWRSLDGAAQFVLCDLGSLQTLDTIGLFGLALAAGHVARVRVSALDNTGLAGDLFDSGPVTDAVDPAYGTQVALLPAPVEGRFSSSLGSAMRRASTSPSTGRAPSSTGRGAPRVAAARSSSTGMCATAP